MLQFKGYSKSYQGTLIIAAPDATMEPGLHWLKGENGSGKSTLIKSVAGLIPFDGSITLNNVSIAKERIAYRKLVNYAEAEPQFPPFLTGSDLIRFFINTKGGSEAQVNTLMERLGVHRYAANKMGTYSSGMAKKLSLVLAFIGRPAFILLDEPLITLDQESVSILQEMVTAATASGVSFLVTSHQELLLGNAQFGKWSIAHKTLCRL